MKIVSLILLLSISTNAQAGSVAGNGSDLDVEDHRRAWFVGSRVIKICQKSIATFPVPEQETKTLINKAMNTWKSYLAKNRVNENFANPFPIQTHYEWQPQCNQESDLKFLFGLETPEVTQFKAMYLSPFAFAAKTEVGIWSKGFVWLASLGETWWVPNWNIREHLFATLLHEIGHVFGVPHIENTIMTANLKYLLQFGPRKYWSKIDGDRHLYFCHLCDFNEKSASGDELSSKDSRYQLTLRVGGSTKQLYKVNKVARSQGVPVFYSNPPIHRYSFSDLYSDRSGTKEKLYILNINMEQRIHLIKVDGLGKTKSVFISSTH